MNRYPDIFDLRDWDLTLLKRYQPVFPKSNKICLLCALGPCKPAQSSRSSSGEKEEIFGRCGIDETAFKAREALLTAVIGAASHTSHATRLLEDLIGRFGRDCAVNMGPYATVTAPIVTLITGCNPKVIGELMPVLDYIQGQLTHLLSSVSFGTEASVEDFVSKMLHTGMLDSLALEAADIAQISAMNMPRGKSDSKIIPIGIETVDLSKPVVLIIGHNSTVAHEIMHILKEGGLSDAVEVCGLCCAAADSVRHSHGFKIIGNQASQLEVIQSGIADIVILDMQCIRGDVVEEAKRVGSIAIATTMETALGLKDLTDVSVEDASEYILSNGSGVILDKVAAAEVVLNIAVRSQKSEVRRKTTSRMPHPTAGFLRVGRGPVRGSEIRGIAPSIVMGEVPGIIGIFGCPEEESQKSEERSQKKEESVHKKLTQEFLSMGYIVSAGGCASMDIARGDLFKENSDSFDSGNLINLGSCVSSAHLIAACINIAQIMCHRNLEGNYTEIADYIINRVGAVVILWGGFTQKAFASALGMARVGIPVIFGPRFKDYGMHFTGRDGEWLVKDARLGDLVSTGPAPQHLLCFAENPEELLCLAAKLCMRPNDTSEGRKSKLKNYAGFYKKIYGVLPEDMHLFMRTHHDMPDGLGNIHQFLESKGWKPSFVPDPTIL